MKNRRGTRMSNDETYESRIFGSYKHFLSRESEEVWENYYKDDHKNFIEYIQSGMFDIFGAIPVDYKKYKNKIDPTIFKAFEDREQYLKNRLIGVIGGLGLVGGFVAGKKIYNYVYEVPIEPTIEPSNEPHIEPTNEPHIEPTNEPHIEPSNEPTNISTTNIFFAGLGIVALFALYHLSK